MKNFLLAIGAIGIMSNNIAQITNDGATIFVQAGAIVYSQDYVTNQGATGTIDNSGDIYVEGDWVNSAPNTGLINNSPGTVHLNGGNQMIDGNSETRFFNLELSGTSTVKTLNVNATVTDTLNLTDAELQTQVNRLAFLNPDPNALLWVPGSGFISTSVLGGYISRATNSTSSYIFPVGDDNFSSIYRAVQITPTGATPSEYAVALRKTDPTFATNSSINGLLAGFDVTIKEDALGDVNTEYFHNIARVSGAEPANVNMYWNVPEDGDFNAVARWSSLTNQWENANFVLGPVGTNTAAFGSPDYVANNGPTALANFSDDVFALSTLNNTITIPQFISPEVVDGFNDTWIIENIELYPENNVQIFNRYGVLVYEMDGYDNTWDGKANAAKGVNVQIGNGTLPSGTYFYILDLGIEDLDVYKGYIQIRN